VNAKRTALAGAMCAVAVAAMLGIACGGSGAAAPAVCAPLAVASAGVAGVEGGQGTPYAATLYGGLATISNLTNDLRLRWPGDEPSEDSQFRSAFTTYANTIVCTAHVLVAVPVPDASYNAFAAAFDKVMNDQAAIAEAGQMAVQQRNVTKYREWIDREEAQPGRIRDAFTLLPR